MKRKVPRRQRLAGEGRSVSKDASKLTEQFMALFRGYEHAHGQHILSKETNEKGKVEGRASTKKGAATERDYSIHLSGAGASLGLIPLMADDTVWFAAIDIDVRSEHAPLRGTVEDLEADVRKLELPLVVCRSKSGGAHLYVFCSEPLPAKAVRDSLTRWAAVLGYKGCEIFPKQDSRSGGDKGNWINIAYYGVNSEQGTTRYCIRNGKPIRQLEEFVKYAELMRINREGLKEVETSPKAKEIPVGNRNNTLWKMACMMRGQGMSQEAIEAALLQQNEECEQPMSQRDVLDIARRGSKYEPNPESESHDDVLITNRDSLADLASKADRLFTAMPSERLFKTPYSRRIAHASQHPQPTEGITRDAQASSIQQVDSIYLRDILSSTGKVFQLNAKGLPIPTRPDRDITDALISRVRTSPNRVKLPTLWMLTNTPKLLPDFRIICESGYHAESGILIDAPDGKFADPDPEEMLSAEECNELWAQYFDPCFAKFPIPEDAYCSVIKSAAMCIALRNLLPAVPLTLVTAPASGQGSGKSLIVETISVIATGRRPSVCTYRGVEEFSKHLFILLGAGDPVISVDNIIMTVNHSDLAASITTKGPFKARKLTKDEERVIENNAVLFLNGNALQVATDLTRRSQLIRIEPDCERPEERKFSFHPVIRARQLHPQAAMALLRIARAHARAGFPGVQMLNHPLGGFEEFDQWARGALVWCGMKDPIDTQEEVRQNDPERNANIEMLTTLGSHFGTDAFLTLDIPGKLKNNPLDLDTIMHISGHKQGVEEFHHRKVSEYFKRHLLGHWFDGFRLVKTGRTPNGKTEWRLEMKQEIKNAEQEPL